LKIELAVFDFQGNLDSVYIGRPIPEARLADALGRSRVVALIGPRQSGKTTLARQLVPAESIN
jgi:predicted AAA+ superfamily ATPase